MRARIRKDPFLEDWWHVEVKYWWSTWIRLKGYNADDAMSRALIAAELLIKPRIIEVTK